VSQVFADTGYWIALINPLDGLHDRAMSLSKTLGNSKIVTSEWVLTELLNSFATHGAFIREKAIKTAITLRSTKGVLVVPHSEATFEKAFDLFRQRLDKSWSLTDCASFLIMQQLGITEALSYDRHFEQANFKALLRTME